MIGSRPAKVVKIGDSIVSVNTGEKKNLEGITEFKPTIVQRPERTAVVDSTYLDHSRLATHIAGAPLKTVYYSGVYGADDTARPLDLSADPVNQQYNCYRDMILRVTSPLNPSSQDTDSKEFNIVGSADMYYVLPPNKFDMFVADAGGASTGIFMITEVEKLSYLNHSAYRVEYRLIAIDDIAILEDLERKSIRTLYYDESLLDYFNTPFLDEDTRQKYYTLGAMYDKLHATYMDTFWDRAKQSYRVPCYSAQVLFDPLITDYLRFIGLEDIQRPATMWGVGALDLTRCKTLWWLLKQEGYESLPGVTRTVRAFSTRLFNVHSRMYNITYSRFDTVMYPIVKSPYENTDRVHGSYTAINYGPQDESKDFPIVSSDTYVLSEAFYSSDITNMTTIEKLTTALLKNDPIDIADLTRVGKTVGTLSYIQQFYFMPLVLTIIAMARRKPIWL